MAERLDAVTTLLERAARSLPLVKQEVMDAMTHIKKIKKNRYSDELDALQVMQDALVYVSDILNVIFIIFLSRSLESQFEKEYTGGSQTATSFE